MFLYFYGGLLVLAFQAVKRHISNFVAESAPWRWRSSCDEDEVAGPISTKYSSLGGALGGEGYGYVLTPHSENMNEKRYGVQEWTPYLRGGVG